MFYALAKARNTDGGTSNMILPEAGSTRLEAELNAEAWAQEQGFRLEGVYPVANRRGVNQHTQRIYKGFSRDHQ